MFKGKSSMILYIAGKMAGDDNYVEKFNAAEKRIKESSINCEVINPACLRLPESCTWDDCLDIALKMLDLANGVVFLPDWKESPGACVEYGYALATDKIILKYSESFPEPEIKEAEPEPVIVETPAEAPKEEKPKKLSLLKKKQPRTCPRCGKPITGKGNKKVCDECKEKEEQPE